MNYNSDYISHRILTEPVTGKFCVITKDVKFGGTVLIGHNVIIEGYTKSNITSIGKDTLIKNNVEIREGTIIGANCYIDSGVKTSGDCVIGDNVTLRFNVIIARGVTVEDGAFLAPNVMTEYSDHEGKKMPGIVIGKKAFIGTGTVIKQGVKIGENAIIGANSYVNKDIPPNTKWAGSPVKQL